MTEKSPRPDDLNSQFSNFINGLDMEIGSKPDEKEASEAQTLIDGNPDFHRIEIGNAKFGANVIRSGENIGIELNFPAHSAIYSFEYFERTVSEVIDSGYYGYIHKPTPFVKIMRDRDSNLNLDLRSAWDFGKYEKEIEKGNFTTISFRMNSENLQSPLAKPEDQSTFTYGFVRGNTLKPQNKEYLILSPIRARETNLNLHLYKEILKRHKDYFGQEDEDLKELATHVRKIVDKAFPESQTKA